MENPILFPLGIFPAPVRYIVESLQKYEHYQVDFTAVSFFTAFAAAMGNTWSARFMTGWVSRPILYVVLVGPPSCGKTPPLRQAVAPLLNLDEDSDRIYAQEIRQYRKWEKLTAKQRKQQSLPEEMELPQRKCHVVVNSTIEALVSALRDNPRGVLIYNDEIDSLLSNFNRYNGSDESYFLSLFSGTPLQIHPQVEQRVYLPAQSLLLHYRLHPARYALLAVWRETLAERLFLPFPESLSGYSNHAFLERGFHAGRSSG